jgi:hypothetical protein
LQRKRGAKWGQLRGEYVEVRELAATLRAIADRHQKSLRALAEAMPGYSKSVVSERLSGEQRPERRFVDSFLRACIGDDRHALHVLGAQVMSLWEAADPDRAHRIPELEPVAEEQAFAAVPADIRQVLVAFQEIADTQHMVAQAQLSVTRHQGLAAGLGVMLDRLAGAVDGLAAERDEFRREIAARSALTAELQQTREQLIETQRRLDIAEQLREETQRRLDEALRQCEEAVRLRGVAEDRLRLALERLAETQRPSAAEIRTSATGLSDAAIALMDQSDQDTATGVLHRIEEMLRGEASALDKLRAEVVPPNRGRPIRPAPAALSGQQATDNTTASLDTLWDETYESPCGGPPQAGRRPSSQHLRLPLCRAHTAGSSTARTRPRPTACDGGPLSWPGTAASPARPWGYNACGW